MKCILALFCFVFCSQVIGSSWAKCSSPPSSLTLTTMATLRGGGGLCGPLDRKQVAKIITAANLVNGFVNHQAPEAMLEAYGSKDRGPAAQAWLRNQGAASLALGVAGLALYVFETKIHTAMGWVSVVWLAEHYRALISRQETKIGANPTGRMVFSVLTTWCAYVCFTNADYLNQFLRIYGSIIFLTFLPMAISTAPATSAIFGSRNLSDNALACARASAFWLMANGVSMVAIGSGVDPQTTLGYALGVILLHHITMLFFTKEIEKNNTPVLPIYGFVLLTLVSFGCLAFP